MTKPSFPPSTQAALKAALINLGCVINGTGCTCPSPTHADQQPSATILCGRDGRWRVYCHRCEEHWDCHDVMKLSSKKPRTSCPATIEPDAKEDDSLPSYHFPSVAPSSDPELVRLEAALSGVVARHEYADAAGSLLFVVFRLNQGQGKTYRQARRQGDGTWILKGPQGQVPLYRLPELMAVPADRIVVMVEGEKCADALHSIGMLASTTLGGAGKSKRTDLTPLAGRTVLLAPDHDEPGLVHMQQVADLLAGLSPPAEVLWLDAEAYGLPEGGDLADLIAVMQAEGESLQDQNERIGNLIEEHHRQAIPSGIDRLLDEVKAGLHRPMAWPWHYLDHLTGGVEPMTVTTLCGTPGAGKSLFVLSAAIVWLRQGHSVRMLELEAAGGLHQLRAMALIADEPRLTDKTWIEANPGLVDELRDRYREEIAAIEAAVEHHHVGACTRSTVFEWVQRQVANKVEMIVVDPITAVTTEGREHVWDADQKFVMAVKGLVQGTQSRVIVVTHPRGGSQSASNDGMQGGLAYARFTDQVFWLVHNRKSVRLADGVELVPPVILDLCKTRNGGGSNQRIAFSRRGLRFEDEGIVDRRDYDRPQRRVTPVHGDVSGARSTASRCPTVDPVLRERLKRQLKSMRAWRGGHPT